MLFRIKHDYYTFVSGALISMPISLLFELGSNFFNTLFYFALVSSLLSSIFCYILALRLQDIQSQYDKDKKGARNKNEEHNVWKEVMKASKWQYLKCWLLLLTVIITLAVSIICITEIELAEAKDNNQVFPASQSTQVPSVTP